MSLAGTWGADRLSSLKPVQSEKSTTYTRVFSTRAIDDAKVKSDIPEAKFRMMKMNDVMICQYEDKSAHGTAPSTPQDLSEDSVVSSNSSSMSLRSNAPTTTSLEGAGVNENLAMVRTTSKLLRTGMAPVAVGRSGIREERGINASGLLGERLQPGSFVQRSWLPYDDPALLYKVNGKPEAFMPNDVSLNLGTVPVEVGWSHGRKGTPYPKSRFMDD